MTRFYFAVLALALFAAACAHDDIRPLAPPEVMYEKAEEAAEPGSFLWWSINNCDEAIPLYQDVIDNYPTSQYATLSQLGIADCYFSQEQWNDSIFYYQEFEKKHAHRPQIWRVRYRLAEAFREQSLDYDLDMTEIEQAYYYYSRVAEADNEYKQEAARKAREQAELLAKRILYIGRFYERNEEWLAAVDRYEELVAAFPTQPQAKEAYERAVKILEKIGQGERAAELPKPRGA